MQDFINKAKRAFSRFMLGRYGGDQLGIALMVLAILCSLLALRVGQWANVLSLIILVVACVRVLSRDFGARRKENDIFLSWLARPRAWVLRQWHKWQNRKTKAYVRCPHCNAEFALPKGRGRLRATCPKCGQKSEHTV